MKEKTQAALTCAERICSEVQSLTLLAEEARIELHRMNKERERLARELEELERHKAELLEATQRLTTEVNELVKRKKKLK